jgi:hypothetical protein
MGWIIAIGLGMVGTADAAPLNLKQVSADAKWIAHLDVDAMRDSVVVKKGYEHCKDQFKAIGEQLAEIRTACQVFDPTTDLHGLTFYGTQYTQDAGVAIIHAKFSDSVLQFLREKVQQLPDFALSHHGDYELFTWTHGKDSRHERSMTAAYVKPDLMIFGTSAAEVAAALDVLDGAKADLVGKTSPLAAEAPSGSLLVVRIAELSTVGLPIESPLIKRTETLSLILGENNNEAFLTGILVAKTAKTATEVKEDIEKGLTAALIATNDSDFANFVNAVQVTSANQTVTVDVRGPAEVGWFYLEKLASNVAIEGKKHINSDSKD